MIKRWLRALGLLPPAPPPVAPGWGWCLTFHPDKPALKDWLGIEPVPAPPADTAATRSTLELPVWLEPDPPAADPAQADSPAAARDGRPSPS